MTTEALTAIKAAGSADRWSIDHSAGRPILMLDGCSVIEAEDAEYLLRLIKRDQANGKTAEEIIQASVDLEIADHPNGHWTTEQVKRVAARSIAAALSPTVGTGEERQTPAPLTHLRGDGEAAIIECLSAGEPFVFDPATNFLHADDGTVEGGIRYLPAPEGFALIPSVPTDEMIEAICQEHTRCHWPDDFDRTAQAIRRQDARDGYEVAIKLAATTEGQP